MSIGNTKDNGNKGNNVPYQLAVLQLLDAIRAASGGGGGITPVLGVAPSVTRVTAAGTVAAGARSVTVYNAGMANGTVLGTVIKPGESFTWDAGAVNNKLAAVAYDGTGTELVISKVI